MFNVGRPRGTWDFVSPSRHASTDGLAYGNALGIKVVQAEDIDPEVVGRHALAVKGVNPADLTEEVPRCLGMELVFRERIFASEQAKLVLMDLDHQRILAPTDGAVAHRELWEVRFDLKANCAAMAAAEVLLPWAVTIHGR